MLQGLDIIVLAVLVSSPTGHWTQARLATSLGVSQSQVHYALNRANQAGLWNPVEQKVRSAAFLEFAIHAIKYFFPPELGAPTRGVLTAHSAPPLTAELAPSQAYVWPNARGQDSGLALAPLHRSAAFVAEQNPMAYSILALIDALRAGRVRDRKLAEDHLRLILDPP